MGDRNFAGLYGHVTGKSLTKALNAHGQSDFETLRWQASSPVANLYVTHVTEADRLCAQQSR